jgi:plastocyanin
MSKIKRPLLAAALVAATVGVLAPGTAGKSGDDLSPALAPPSVAGTGEKPPTPVIKRVVVDDNFFDARSVTLPRAARVVWQWKGMNRHNVTFTRVPEGASRRSSATKRSGKWKRAFYKPGLYKYVCTLFTGMRGSINVSSKTPPR